ncbi:hypothetical protein PAECIP111892_00700 [Paenibacillus auburnensis]|uniref:DUF6199 domain-containing protein n=1 Tax=Paenibacillus auburnensis TaxID=2905649 RepID=A0ABN8FYZ3_9BACL|nr:DUF6199 family natural product biosynthesis protein [Paenibacillus auburnensis]CAH1191660.1 hypothetical protein PAECIP111892_00700 [Paenibacillus auburnensis]
MIVLGIFSMIIGIGTIAFGIYVRKNPTFDWRMNEGWKVSGDSEPSQAYIDSRTFSGAVAIWIGAFFIAMGILQFI